MKWWKRPKASYENGAKMITDAMKTLWIFKTPKTIICLTTIFLVLISAGMSSAKTVKDQYVEAEGCYKKLSNDPELQKTMDNWMDCIKKFQSVYQGDPNGPWAAAALYMSGNLFRDKYVKFSRGEDKKEALDAYERTMKRFPKSQYRNKALDEVAALSARKAPGKVQIASSSDEDDGARDKYQAAKSFYQQLKENPEKQKYRSYWFKCIEKFDAVYRHDTKGPWAAAGLYMTGVLHEELSDRSYMDDDRKKALEIYEKVISDYPLSQYRQKAMDMRDKLCKSHPVLLETTDMKSSEPVSPLVQSEDEGYREKENGSPPLSGDKAVIREIRCWSNPSYTRIVVDADRQVTYEPHLLKKDTTNNKPPRLYLDLDDSRLGKDIKTAIPVDDNLLSGIRAGQFTNKAVRVVIDIKSFESYKIFHLQEPFRIIIDVLGVSQKKPVTVCKPTDPAKKDKIPSSALAKQLALGVSRIVIDPGHGGKDPGAKGFGTVYEKEITLQIARKLAKKLKQDLNCEVLLTRDKDRYITLEGRTAFANTQNADLFVSIHANAHEDRKIYGLETFFLNLATDDDSIRVAARENATSAKNISDLHSILSDLMQNAKINESSRLASHVQDAMFRDLKMHYSQIKNNGVKQAPFYVLLGAQMPSILIETSFISNPREYKRLSDSQYQNNLCDAIAKGVVQYVKEISPCKISDSKRKNGTTG
jgi:N-acetylmuramoyl-L-alanine amidase